VQLLTAPIAVLVDAFSLTLSAALTLAIRSHEPEPNPGAQRHGIGHEISAGLRPLYRDSRLRSITGSSMIYLFFSSVMLAVYVLYATGDLQITPAALGLIFGVGGAGAVLGALIAAHWARHLGIGPAMIVANVLAGLFTLLIPLAGDVPLAPVVVLGVAQFAAQMMGAIFYINQISIRQVVTPNHLLGRMNAGYRFLTMGMLPVGSFVGGVLGETIGLKATLILGAIGMLLPSAWLLLSPLRSLNIEQSSRS
jgi:predicted MFS family arabinose efflux permease